MKKAHERWPEPGTLRAAARDKAPALGADALAPIAALIAAGVAGIGLARIERLAHFAGAHTTATLAAIGISICAAALVAAVSLADQRTR
jgi:hypothetical protein